MLRAARPLITSTITTRSKRVLSSSASKSVLEGDNGKIATQFHHHMTTLLAVTAPIVFMVPDSMTEGIISTSFGVLFATTVSAHSWVGLNYVATDYVPKISKALIGPARIVNAGMAIITLVGLSKIAFSPGGIKGTVKGLWKPNKETQQVIEQER